MANPYSGPTPGMIRANAPPSQFIGPPSGQGNMGQTPQSPGPAR